MTQPWVQSKVRDRVARIVVLSLVIGYSAAAALRLAIPSAAPAAITMKPTAASFGPVTAVSKPIAAPKPKSKPTAKQNEVPSQKISQEAWPVSANGHLVVAGKDILLTDHNRIRVGELPFRPVKKALIGFQKTSKMPTVVLTAAADIPEAHVGVVKKFIERFYGWKVTTTTTEKAGTFELDVAPSQGVTP